jgi:hypothetical protein
MTPTEAEIPGQFYHGTPHELSPGDVVYPNCGWAHATTAPFVAATYALYHHGQQVGGHIYQVEPTGDVERDLHVSGIGATSSYRSQSGFRVSREYGRSPEEVYYDLAVLPEPDPEAEL